MTIRKNKDEIIDFIINSSDNENLIIAKFIESKLCHNTEKYKICAKNKMNKRKDELIWKAY